MKEYDRDSFWKIDKLVPKKQGGLSTFSTGQKLVDYTVSSDDAAEDDGRFKLTLQNGGDTGKKEDFVYTPTGLIKHVTVRHIPDKFDFHANFVKAAQLYFNFNGAPCDFVPFYSYMPQYTQLNEAQKGYYFYWRGMVRSGQYIKTDYSYFYLYVYEIINLPNLIPAEKGIEMLADLWCAYRKSLPNIDANMALWIQDYCLCYNVACPADKLRDFIFSVIGNASFKEFYLSDAETLGEEGTGSVVAYLSDYDWRCGKYAGGDNKEVYSRHLLGAMSLLVSRLLDGGRILGGSETAKMERRAFRGALTTSAVKYLIMCEYRPIAAETDLRGIITSAVKYTENKLRALMGVKSRLAVRELQPEYSALIDGYFAELFDKVNRERVRASRPEYERLYESDSVGISSADADEIERASWSTTARLVEDIDEYDEADTEAEAVTAEPPNNVNEAECFGLDKDRIEFIRAALNENYAEMRVICDRIGELADSVADGINEAFSDGFGDVILENMPDGYVIIEDYKEDIEAWLLKQTR